MRTSAILTMLIVPVLFAGCATRSSAPTATDVSGTGAAVPAVTSGAPAGEQLTPTQLALRELERGGMIVYFDYDRAEIKSEYLGLITAHARFLSADPARRVRLEGHADERGTREYNIGLGERRAQAVRRALLLQGVADGQITTISYGEERPAVAGSDETAYSRNRRVELGYPGI